MPAYGPRRRQLFSPLMMRIMVVNAIALFALGGGILYLNEFRANLVEARRDQLLMQANIIAGALGESAVAGPESAVIDLAPARQIIDRLTDPETVRTRLFGTSGGLLVDSQSLSIRDRVYEDILQESPASGIAEIFTMLLYAFLDSFDDQPHAPSLVDGQGLRAASLVEVSAALEGASGTMLRRRADGQHVITVAVPVQRFRRVVAALMIASPTDDIEAIVRTEQLSIMRVFAVAFALTILLSFFLARTLVRPIRVLAGAAERVRRGMGRDEHIPEFATRRDEIGDLSRALSEMTRALYNQIDAVERFAADVAHEIKNPLTSMQSALETLERANKPEIQARLIAVLHDDVRRMDRLISDISDASRLDAELTRGQKEPVNIAAILKDLIHIYETAGISNNRSIKLTLDQPNLYTSGVEARLSQVWRNLLDNALSFTPEGGAVYVRLSRADRMLRLTVEDDGPGLPEGAGTKIFKRFYSERPDGEAFGKHSGLGLAISRQIVEAHGGRIVAENRTSTGDGPCGARFIVTLPESRLPAGTSHK